MDYSESKQQQMVKIKYNNSKMNIKRVSSFIQTRKRTLRSANKWTNQDNLVTASSSEQKVIQEINKIIENQQSINLSKSTDLLHQDLKIPLIPTYQSQQSPQNCKVTALNKSQNQKIDGNLITQKQHKNNELCSVKIFNTVAEQRFILPRHIEDLFETPVKSINQNVKNEYSNQFKQSRKSYRKLKRSNITQIPYRKFQDPFQQKIVILINRILHNKGTQKDILNFTDKIPKISSKDIYNPFIISGIKTIINLIEKSSILTNNCKTHLKAQLKKLSQRILTEFQKTQDYNNIQLQKKQSNYDSFKPKFIKKIYKFLLQTNQYAFNDAKDKSVFLCEQFFAQSNNFTKEDELLSFFKDQKFLHE